MTHLMYNMLLRLSFVYFRATQHSSLECHSPPQGLSPPYKHRLLGNQYDADFPLRKTGKEIQIGTQ